MSSTTRRRRWGVVVLVLVAVPAADLVLGPEVALTGLLVAVPLVAWTLVGPARTAVSAFVAIAVAGALRVVEDLEAGPDEVVRFVGLVIAGVVAVELAVHRVRRERAAAELEAGHRRAELALARVGQLERVSEAGLTHLELDSLLEAMLVEVRAALGADSASVLLGDEDAAVLRVRSSIGLEPEARAGAVVPFGRGVAGHVAARREPMLIADLARRSEVHSPLLRDAGVRAMALVPMVVGAEVVGVLHVGAFEPDRFGVDDLALLDELGRRVAVAVQRARLFEALRDREATTAAVLDTVLDGIVTIDGSGTVLSVNPAVEATFGYRPDELVGRNVSVLMPEPDRSRHDDYLRRYHETGERRIIGVGREVTGRRRDGATFPVELAVTETTVGGRKVFVGSLRDVSERKEAERRLTYAALHDPLTGLANRTVLDDRLDAAVARVQRHGGVVALLFVDLDRFKRINDTMGHDAGDQLLRTVAARLQHAIRTEDLLVRLGGDEFVVLCETLRTGEDAVDVAERLRAALRPPVRLPEGEVHVSASIGVSLSTDTPDAGELLRSADSAMYRVKQRGRDGAELYDQALQAEAEHRTEIGNELRRAVLDGQLVLHYQPVIDLTAGEVVGAEALLRWQHPERGLVAPGEFLADAAHAGLLPEIGARVLAEACREAATWAPTARGRPRTVAVNVSAEELVHPGLARAVSAALEGSGLLPDRLRLEVHEDALMADPAASVRCIDAVRELGVGVVIDGFGAGASSLVLLRELRVDALKLDPSLLDVGDSAPDRSVARAVAGLAGGLGIALFAGGLESREQLEAVSDEGYELVQGHYLAGPAPPSELVELRAPRGGGAPAQSADGVPDHVGPAGIEPATKGL